MSSMTFFRSFLISALAPKDAVDFALAAPEPDPAELTRYIWAED